MKVVATLEELKAGASVRGLSPDGIAKVIQVEWFGDQAVKVTFEDATGAVKNRLVYRNEEPTLEIVSAGRPWSFDGDGSLLRQLVRRYPGTNLSYCRSSGANGITPTSSWENTLPTLPRKKNKLGHN